MLAGRKARGERCCTHGERWSRTAGAPTPKGTRQGQVTPFHHPSVGSSHVSPAPSQVLTCFPKEYECKNPRNRGAGIVPRGCQPLGADTAQACGTAGGKGHRSPSTLPWDIHGVERTFWAQLQGDTVPMMAPSPSELLLLPQPTLPTCRSPAFLQRFPAPQLCLERFVDFRAP